MSLPLFSQNDHVSPKPTQTNCFQCQASILEGIPIADSLESFRCSQCGLIERQGGAESLTGTKPIGVRRGAGRGCFLTQQCNEKSTFQDNSPADMLPLPPGHIPPSDLLKISHPNTSSPAYNSVCPDQFFATNSRTNDSLFHRNSDGKTCPPMDGTVGIGG